MPKFKKGDYVKVVASLSADFNGNAGGIITSVNEQYLYSRVRILGKIYTFSFSNHELEKISPEEMLILKLGE